MTPQERAEQWKRAGAVAERSRRNAVPFTWSTEGHEMPTGLVLHCETCNLVIPSDAPKPDGADCIAIAANKLAFFNPNESVKGQHTMAVAAWALIHHKPLAEGHAESVEYHRQFRKQPLAHYTGSKTFQALSPQQIAEQQKIKPKRDGFVYGVPCR